MKYYVVDAFTDELFHGNPAGICLLESAVSDGTMQKIAFENNLSETAFLLAENGKYRLRWFTPKVEVDLCGHATLATAFVLMDLVSPEMDTVSFETKSGVLTVTKADGIYTLDFPSRRPVPAETPAGLEAALGCRVLETYRSRDLVALLETARDVRDLDPDFEALKMIEDAFAVTVTATGEDCDFVSRFFAPKAGVNEDPVTGSSHTNLIPLWHEKLGRTKMTAKQLSKRGGVLYCEDAGDRVRIGGRAVCYLAGELKLR
jgi:PhzF family phenazine biosynthesis protein